ncbi:SDR family oxidoreductase [Lacinutrix sp. C3R15]|uniref:SDR family oxidoreductase n=1 Tax=Flavobacteriaceae TaxID=49546 RepID=UPI001C09CDEF|nr:MULTISPECIES: SDR family oxidoreductase [Flavobacteriaceae]MBU2938754.1 SDR family oxidoreductase [Lacinutrix sp. C3R15]MDO6622067.1 SDR family oxidoreductase [Oceanihabitans sp. 1_MG-2023]
MNFKNKVVWITGASSGIGKSLAITLSKENCKLILSSRRKEALMAVKALCNTPENVVVLPLDLAETDSLAGITEIAISCFGKIDLLINNGGISQRSPIIDTTIAVDRKLMEVDYLGTVALSKALLPHFVANKSGHYVVVSSLMGKFSSPFRSAYCGAKHALHGFFDALRLEHDKDNIKVTMICPGFVNTDVARNALTADGSKQTHQDEMTEKGLNVEVFTKKMLQAIKKEKFEAYIGKKERFGIYLKRISPRLLHKLVLRSKVR